MKFQQSVSIVVLASVLAFGACKKKDAAVVSDISESWIKSQVSLDTAKRDISAEDAQAALEKIELWEQSDEVSWDERSGENGYYTFKNLKFADGEGVIGTAKISGLRMLKEDAAFADHFELSDITITEPDEGTVVTIKSVHYVLPDGENFMELVESLDIEDLSSSEKSLSLQNMFRSGDMNLTIGEGYLDDMSVTGDDITMTIDFAGWAEDEDNRKLSLLFKDISGNGEENGEAFEFNLDNLSMKGLDLEYYDNMMGNNIAAMNPFEPNVENIKMDNFSIKGGGLFVDMPKMHGWYTDKKSGKFQAITEMPSLVFGFDREPEDKELVEFKQALNDLGYEQMEFSFKSKSHLDENADLMESEISRLSMKDGFDLNFDYKITGLKNMVEKMGDAVDTVDYSDTAAMNAANLEMIMEAFKAMNLHHFSMEFDDNSILEKSFNMAAKKQDVGADLIRQQAKGGVMMSTMAAQSEYQAELSKDFADNLVKLIDEGGKFKVEIKPMDGFDFGKAFEDYSRHQESYMEALQSQMHDESVTKIVEPEPFDTDGLLRAMGIDFQHEAD